MILLLVLYLDFFIHWSEKLYFILLIYIFFYIYLFHPLRICFAMGHNAIFF